MRAAPGERRGVVLPLVCVLLTVLVGAASLALDLGRFNEVGAELQTAADAGALAGGRGLQVDPGNERGGVEALARQIATRNRALGTLLTTDEVRVEPVRREDDGTVTPSAGWGAANGVRVTARRTVPFLFGRFTGLTPPTVERRATAWVANVTRASCARPLGLPFQYVWEQAGRTGKANPNDRLNARDLAKLQAQPSLARTRVLRAAWNPSARDYSSSTEWAPVMPGGNNSKNGYLEQFDPSNSECAQSAAEVGGEASALNGSRVERDTHDGMAWLCGTAAAACGANGTVVRVGWVNTNGAGSKGPKGGSANSAEYHMTGLVRVVCYFGEAFGGKNAPATSNCPATGFLAMEPGTLVVEVLPPAASEPVRGDEYGNAAGGIQRLMLVQ